MSKIKLPKYCPESFGSEGFESNKVEDLTAIMEHMSAYTLTFWLRQFMCKVSWRAFESAVTFIVNHKQCQQLTREDMYELLKSKLCFQLTKNFNWPNYSLTR